MPGDWFYRTSGTTGDETIGPLSSEDMVAHCRERIIVRDTLVFSRQSTRGMWVPAGSVSLLRRETQEGADERALNTSPPRGQRAERIVPGAKTSVPWGAVALFVLVGVVGVRASASIVRRFQLAGWKVSSPDLVRVVEKYPAPRVAAEAKRKQRELQQAIRSTPKGWERFCERDREIPTLTGKKISPGDMGTVDSVLCQKIFPDGTLLAWIVSDTGPARVKVYGLDTSKASNGRRYAIPSTVGWVVGKEVVADSGETFTVPTLTLVDISSVLFRRLNGYGERVAETDPLSNGAEMVEMATEGAKKLEKLAPPSPGRTGPKGRTKRNQ